MNISTYPLSNHNFIVILPDIPRWFVIDRYALDILESMTALNSLEDIIAKHPPENSQEIEETYNSLKEILDASYSQIDVPMTTRALTDSATVAMISVTDSCNLRCAHCYVDANSKHTIELSVEQHTDVASQIKKVLCTNNFTQYRVFLTGGEPFIRKDLLDIVRAYKSFDLGVGISTNSLLITDLDIPIIKELDIALSVSLDGATKERHEFIRGPGTFNATIDRIKSLTSSGVKVGINTLVHEMNFSEFEDILELAYELGCKGVNPINLIQLGRACNSQLRRVPEVEIFQRLANYINTHKEHISLFEKTTMFSSIGAALLGGISCQSCGVGNRPCVYIGTGGNIYPCANTQRDEFCLGNINEGSLKDFLRDDHPTLCMLRTLDVDKLNPKCSTCDVRKFCGGDCRGETYNVTMDLKAPYVACKDRHDSIVSMMEIVAKHPWMFENRANEYITNADRVPQ